jgi:hypothetical protein
MVLDVIINNESMTIEIADPFHPDIGAIISQIEHFAYLKGAHIAGLDIKGLIPKIIKGIAGCENGCPADAKNVVSTGFRGFALEYIEGGILSARSTLEDGKIFQVRMFPDF